MGCYSGNVETETLTRKENIMNQYKFVSGPSEVTVTASTQKEAEEILAKDPHFEHEEFTFVEVLAI